MDVDISTLNKKKNTDQVISVTRENLNEVHLKSLAKGECSIIHIKTFIDKKSSDKIASGAKKLGYKSYLNVPSVRRIGMAFYETEGKKELLDLYFKNTIKCMEELREACSPIMSPIDTLRCKLDEIWTHGAHLQTLFGKKMFVGLSRMVEPNTAFLAHHDLFEQDAPNSPEAKNVKAQFGANIYVQTPKKGGELLMWHMNMEPEKFDELRDGNYGLQVESLGKPDLSIKPDTGDLLIFDSRKMHAVAPPIDRSRLALSFFIAYRGDDKPLTFWS